MRGNLLLAAGTVVPAAATSLDSLPSWVGGLAAIAASLGWFRFYFLPRAEKRIADATAREKELGGDRITVDTAEEVVKFARSEFDRITGEVNTLRGDYRVERERADVAHQDLVRTQTALSTAQAQLAEAVARSANDRSALSRQIHALEEALHKEELKTREVCDELETLQAQMGNKERRAGKRRVTDSPAAEHRTARPRPTTIP